MIVKAGAVAYILDCAPVRVTYREYGNCSQEIPVWANGKPRFADPLTFVLRDFPTPVICNNMMPVMWKFANRWFCSHPKPIPTCKPPQSWSIKSDDMQLSRMNFTHGMSGGLISKKARKAYNNLLAVQNGREAVVTSLTYKRIYGAALGHMNSYLDIDGVIHNMTTAAGEQMGKFEQVVNATIDEQIGKARNTVKGWLSDNTGAKSWS